MSFPQLSDERRGEEILAVLDTAFGELLAADPAAFRVKFRKMAASAFAFYRGTACLFYHDLDAERAGRPYPAGRTWTSGPHGCGSTAICTPRTSARTWTPPAG
ncbi:hypothetical protein SGLAM104S_08250 [Streptomyces glaucescens]